MTLRQYAAIKLCVPDSGLDWLDDMIRQAQRDWFAGQALAGIITNLPYLNEDTALPASVIAYDIADAMLSARKGGAA
jgi:hypothetical protein